MQAHIRAVLFDYGLVLTGPPLPQAWQAMQSTLQADETAFAHAYWRDRLEYDRGSLDAVAYWRSVSSQLGRSVSAEQVEALIKLDTRLWTQVNQPMVDWALRLRVAGTRTGILSNLGDRMMHGVMSELDWMQGFDHHTFSHTLRIVKPDPAIYRHAADGLGVAPAAILFVDDREENIAGAEAAGMQALQYSRHEVFVDSLARRGLLGLWENGTP